MRRSLRAALLLSAAAIVACGGRVSPVDGTIDPNAADSGANATGEASAPLTGTNTLTGSFQKKKVTVNDTVAFLSHPVAFGADFQTQLLVSYTDASALCSGLAGNVQQSNTRYVNLKLIQHSPTAAPSIRPGTYTIAAEDQALPGGDSIFVGGSFSSLDFACHAVEVANVAMRGTITIAEVTAAGVSGSFSFDFDSPNDHFEGTFNAPLCGVDLETVTPACR